jgi:hypothetical protein
MQGPGKFLIENRNEQQRLLARKTVKLFTLSFVSLKSNGTGFDTLWYTNKASRFPCSYLFFIPIDYKS